MNTQSKINQIQHLQDYLNQLTDTDLGGTHDFSFEEVSPTKGLSPKALVTSYYDQKNEDDDSIYFLNNEHGIDMFSAPNWEDVLYQICQELHMEGKYEEMLDKIENYIGSEINAAWQICPKEFVYQEVLNTFEDESVGDMSSKWQDLLLHINDQYYVMHFGILE